MHCFASAPGLFKISRVENIALHDVIIVHEHRQLHRAGEQSQVISFFLRFADNRTRKQPAGDNDKNIHYSHNQ